MPRKRQNFSAEFKFQVALVISRAIMHQRSETA
jgi:hypothetical protein